MPRLGRAALGGALAAALAATPAAAVGSLPACSGADRPARFSAYEDWHRTILDTNFRLERSYRPHHLVSIARAGVGGGHVVRRVVIDDLRALTIAARRAGAPLAVLSGYRSYETQVAVFRSLAAVEGMQKTTQGTALPGHSEHQLGTAIDFGTPGARMRPWFHPDWGRTRQGRWLTANAWRYGFVMSYPRGSRARTCYAYEPWHWRYVGREMAARVRESRLTLREYLWLHADSPPVAPAAPLEPARSAAPPQPARLSPPVQIEVGGVWAVGPADATLAR